MRLKEVELHGFKSFANKTTIKFTDQYSVIVGPNGCGKSNISDAIRWVLGEQSPTSLRGSKMEDVVFSGTSTQRPMNYCKVKISFDGVDLEDRPDKISVARTVYRTGESKYEINQKAVRLKDVRELFMDTGLGKEGYSIISQGKIDEILSSKAEDRKALLDEAAGVSKYKYKRDEALKKLHNTINNLERLENITDEAFKNLKYLQKESDKAQKALEIKNELLKLELANFKDLGSNLDLIKNKVKESLKNLTKDKHSYLKSTRKLEEAIKEIDQLILEKDKTLKVINRDLNRENKVYNEAYTNLKLSKQKKENLNQELERINSSILKEKENKERLDKRRDSLEAQTKDLDKELDELRSYINEIRNQLGINIESRKELSDKEASLDLKIGSIKSKIDEIRLEKRTSQSMARNYVEEINSLKTSIEDLKTKSASLEEEKFQVQAHYQNLKEEVNKLEIEKEKVTRDLMSLREEKGQLGQDLNNINGQINSLKSNYMFYKNIHDSYEGYYKPVQNFLKSARNNPEISKLFISPLSEAIKVEKPFEKAIEYALGSQVQNIITHTAKDAEILINYLKNNNIGRLTFLPVERFSPGPRKMGSLKEEDYLAFASDVVSYDKEIEPVIEYLLGRTIITEDLGQGRLIAKKSNNRIVSLDGDIINPSGSMVGGSNKSSSSGLVNRKEKLDYIKNQLTDLDQEDKTYRGKIARVDEGIEIKESELENLNEKLNYFYLKTKDEEKKIAEIDNNVKIHTSQVENIEENIINRKLRLKAYENQGDLDLSSLVNDLARFEKEKEELARTKESSEDKVNEKRLKLERLMTKEEVLDRDLRISSNELEEKKNEVIDLEKSLNRMESDLVKSEKEIRNLNDKILEYEYSEESSKGAIEKIEKKSIIIEADLVRLREGDKKAREDLLESIKNLNILKEEIDISRKSYKDAKKEFLDNKSFIMDAYGLYELELKDLINKLIDPLDNEKSLHELRKEFRKLGPYNTDAIEKYELIKKEYDFYNQQREDLLKAKNDVEDLINKLEEKINKDFAEAFDRINQKFSHIFARLFEGGKANLVLTNNEDKGLGVDIEAKLPGKAKQNLSLLSGGERSLIAVSLLFAFFEINPAPFCILDEADAALDESNISRYLDYLKSFKDIQFIIITHRKTSMEIADRLFGVTMEEEGISKVVSLELEKLLEL